VPEFVPGRQLCAAFYRDVVAPALPVPHAAGLLGAGSDVLGYDTERSTDHDWGPRCRVFVDREALDAARAAIAHALPEEYDGWPVALGRDGRQPRPQVLVDTLSGWLRAETGWELDAEAAPTSLDWLLVPQTRLLGLTRGAVLADPRGELSRLRDRFAWYPEPVWWWLIACQWQRLAQEEPFVHRTAEVGDELGSRVVAARLVRDCVRLALLMGRQYAPYGKWLGTAFERLPDPDGLGHSLVAATAATSVEDRERALGEAYRSLAARFNALAPDLDLDTQLRSFHDRPARVLGCERFARSAQSRVADAFLTGLPLVGSVDQVLDSADVLAHPQRVASLRGFYTGLAR
jgi:uncharacterized protein DUF4037